MLENHGLLLALNLDLVNQRCHRTQLLHVSVLDHASARSQQSVEIRLAKDGRSCALLQLHVLGGNDILLHSGQVELIIEPDDVSLLLIGKLDLCQNP